MEKDDEIAGQTGSHYTAQNWMYDSRIGKRWNIDPVFKEWESPYASFANNPIINIDPFGSDTINFNKVSTTTIFRSTMDRPDIVSSSSSFNIEIIQCEGEDVFLWNNMGTIYDGDNVTSFKNTTEIKPNAWNRSGITKSPGLFGLYMAADFDNVTLGKLMVANPELSDYLIAKNESYRYNRLLGIQSNFVNDVAMVASFVSIAYGGYYALRNLATKPAMLKPYNVGGGHHPVTGSAFRGVKGYNYKTALAIPNDELIRLNVNHSTVTGAQSSLYSAYSKTGKALTWEAMQKIETAALVKGGMNQGTAAATVKKAINALKSSGVSSPARIPWGR